jgi:phosphatidylserine decarboxylase
MFVLCLSSLGLFFARKLKPDARPVETPDDPNRLVSGADCRLMAFETTSEATKLWIKGREFTVAQLLGDAYKDQAERYVGGALVIFRLAPQDYHRFNSPVDGTIGPMTYISGEYYTVNVSINVLFGYSYVVYSCVVRVCVYSPKLSGRR